MRGYGLPRRADVAEIGGYGRASHVGKLREKCGVFKGYIRNAATKAQTRRYWKRKARREGRLATGGA